MITPMKRMLNSLNPMKSHAAGKEKAPESGAGDPKEKSLPTVEEKPGPEEKPSV